jgi:Na+/proline symporter/nitrogen-specific signal transduction histidine kinase
MNLTLLLVCSLAYVSLLFLIAWWVDKRSIRGWNVVENPHVYALSLAVYCTAWTFYGSVGRAASGGLSFLGVYLGPTLLAPVWYLLLHKMTLISKSQRITSIADFISSRYGKSTGLGVLVTVFIIIGIVPYISIQLRAVEFGLNTLTRHGFSSETSEHFWLDAGFWVALAMALFAVIFGARKLDPNERHEGMVAAIAFESIVKLLTFVAVGAFVTYGIFDGFGDIFHKALNHEATTDLTTFEGSGVTPFSWGMLMLLSLLAVMLLPRQFHISVVENTSPRHIGKAMWVFPLYLLIINIFVLPVALAGKMLFDNSVHPDTYVLSLPMAHGASGFALAAFIGGFSAATSMVVVEATALSIMFSNHIVVPLLIRARLFGQKEDLVDGAKRLLDIRRISVLLMLVLAYLYHKAIPNSRDLVSVGLISFTAAAQLGPAVIGGMYWKRATQQGAMAGLWCGFILWAYCLPLPAMAQAGLISDRFLTEGLFGIVLFKPYELFGMQGMDPITHAAFWSLLINTWVYAIVSVNTRPSTLNLTQADIFVNIEKYIHGGQDYDIVRRRANMQDIQMVLNRFLGDTRTDGLLREFEKNTNTSLANKKTVEEDFVNFAETHLAGAVGAASARLAIERVTTEEPITIEEVMRFLEQTKEALDYSRFMEEKNTELEAVTQRLTAANEQLKTLDRLKADFITTVTHELRTPVTSIKALSKILLDYYNELDESKRSEYLRIIVNESDRIGRLINQVLDIEKIQSENTLTQAVSVDFSEVVRLAADSIKPQCLAAEIECTISLPEHPVRVKGDPDKLIQIVVNLLSNAHKFVQPQKGRINITLKTQDREAILSVQDNGPGIPQDAMNIIFERFTQIQNTKGDKPHGSGLGLFITKMIVNQHGGKITASNNPGDGALFEVCIPLEK